MNTKVNCVVGEDFFSAQDMLDFCSRNNIKLRFLKNLSMGQKAVNTINLILKKNEAELVGHEITLMSSDHRLDYEINHSYNFGVKCIRNFYLKSLCDKCPIRKNGKCYEGFYGIRVENKPLKVRLCLYQDGYPFTQTSKEFFASPQFKEMEKNTKNIKNYLICDSIIDEQRKNIH